MSFLRKKILYFSVVLAVILFTGCAASSSSGVSKGRSAGWAQEIYRKAIDIASEEEYHPDAPAVGTDEVRNETVYIDYSDISRGLITAGVDNGEQSRIKLMITGGGVTYTYSLDPGDSGVFPLTCGDGAYQAVMCRNIGDDRYAIILSADLMLEITDEFSPFLCSDRFVDYSSAPVTAALAGLLCDSDGDTLATVKNVFEFTVDFLSYDEELAANAESDYRPRTDEVLEKGKGICFDYASLMASMLRCCGIPCKLVVGYAGSVYHAWISVWLEEQGWVENVVFFDGVSWQRMDPTFTDSAGVDTASEFAQNDSNYREKFIY